MILVDTSVLISFLKGIEKEQVRKFEDIIQKNIPFGINNYIYQELLQGAKNEKEYIRRKIIGLPIYRSYKGSPLLLIFNVFTVFSHNPCGYTSPCKEITGDFHILWL